MPTATLPSTKTRSTTPDAQTPLYPVPVGAKSTGITMFDWLAAMAMQGLITHGMKVKADRAMSEAEKDDEMAERAYKIATAMLRARSAAIRTLEPPPTASAIPSRPAKKG